MGFRCVGNSDCGPWWRKGKLRGKNGEYKSRWRAPFLEAANGVQLGWQSCGLCAPWALGGCSGGVGRGEKGPMSAPNCHALLLPVSSSPLYFSLCLLPSIPSMGKIESELIKATDCLEMEGKGWEAVWGPAISLLCNNLVVRSGIKPLSWSLY